MEGIEFQLRRHVPVTSYPLPLDQRIEQGDLFRQARQKFEAALKTINHFYSSPQAPPHKGPPQCDRCASKKRQTLLAYYAYYLATDPGRWDSDLTQYRVEIERRFNNPDISLEEIHQIFQAALRDHLKQDMCTSLTTDSSEIYDFKNRTADMFDQGRSTEEILSFYIEEQLRTSPEPDVADFISSLQTSTTPQERAQIYINYYCKANWTDSPQQKNFKAKYARMFGELLSHDSVMTAMKKEAEDSQSNKVAEARNKQAELQMAQSAHFKNKARKAEKDQRMQDRESSPKIMRCSLPGCDVDVNLSEETIECAVCDWFVRKGADKGHAYYCSVEHVEEDFDEHDRNDHYCCMGNRCYYSPQPGPPGETGAGGICPDCEEHEVASYFCSQECYSRNLDVHRYEFHYGRGIHSEADSLDMFRPASDLQLLS